MQRVDPALGGRWPSAVVILSNQIYAINRYPSSDPNNPCRVRDASIRAPYEFDYIRRAALAGVRVVIRIYPSPGNFYDWNDPEKKYHRLSSGGPIGPEGYCRPDLYRSVGDISDEMGAIHNLNAASGFSEYGFEPANEPNAEWYTFKSIPAVNVSTAWLDMDGYFSMIHYYVDAFINMSIRVLTPPMSQSAFAELKDVRNCQDMRLSDAPLYSGYDKMAYTYGGWNDGVDWHNYWIQGKEGYNVCPDGQHVSLYFPQWMKNAIVTSGKPTTISEADLSSQQQGMGNALISKDSAAASAESIRHFMSDERTTSGLNSYIVSWLLNDNTGVAEQDWHEAYLDNGVERQWFALWYTGREVWP